MIQLNQIMNTSFHPTKRLGLLVIFFNMAILSFASSTKYEKVQAVTSPNMEGLIYMSLSEETPTYTDKMDFVVSTTEVAGFSSPVTVWLYAKEEGRDDYVWAGWYQEGALLQEGLPNISVAVTPSQPEKNPNVDKYLYTALWLQPKVIGDEQTVNLGTIDEHKQDAGYTKTATYAVKDYTKPEHFEIKDESVGNFNITLDEVTEADENHDGNATVRVAYKTTGIHGSKTGSTYLKSVLYKGDHSGSSDLYKSINFQVVEDYTPNFDVTHSTIDNAYSIGTTNVGGELELGVAADEVKNKNYAARAAKYSGIGRQQNTTIWKATIEGEEAGYEGLFTIVAGADTETPIIHFNAEEARFKLNTGESKTLKAQLKLRCEYYDESNPAVKVEMPAPKIVYVSATVVQSNTATLQFGENTETPITEKDFGSQAIGADAEMLIPFVAFNIENIQNPIISGTHKDYFEASLSGQRVRVAIKKDVSIPCGEINATITLQGTSKLDHSTAHTTSVNVRADMYLKEPMVEAIGGDKSITFQWEPVFGATSYIVYSDAGATQIKATITDDTKYVETINTNSTTKTYYFVAKNEHGCTSAIAGPINGTAELQSITKSNAAATGLKTGTDQAGNGFPWKAQRDIDVSAAFDKDGNPLFDELHIFALSTGNKADDLSTPCLKYTKDAVKKQYVKTGEDIPEKRGNTSKDSIYKFTDIKGNKKIYVTGYRPYATTGTEGDEGVLYFEGNGGAVLDLYLDNCEIYAQAKGGNSIDIGGSDVTADGYFAEGSGAAIAIQSKSKNATYPFYVNIHIKGSNILDATSGSKASLSITAQNQGIEDNKITHNSSPISIIPTSVEEAVSLSIDDVWPTIAHANGDLYLTESKTNSDTNTPFASIDLGNSKTSLTISGGQIHFLTTAACYQTTTYKYNGSGLNISADAYGLGTKHNSYKNSVTKRVNELISLKDGTLNGSNETMEFYTNRLVIDGGTYIVAPKHFLAQGNEQEKLYNSDLKELDLFTVENTDNKYWKADANGLADLTEKFSSMIDDLFPQAGVDGEFANGSYHYPLSTYYVDGKSYGHASLCPNNNKVNLYLPQLNCQGVHFAWQICAPDIHVNVAGRKYNIQDQVRDVCPQHAEHKYVTDYMLYMQADQYVMDVMGQEYFRPMNLGYGEIIIDKAAEAKCAPSINITNDYEIQKKVYMLMPIEAAKWTLFAAPFDVANVYVIESYPEALLIKDYGGKRGKLPDANVPAARHAQAQRMIDLYAMWYFEGKGQDGIYDFFGDGESDYDGDGNPDAYGKFVMDWMQYERDVNYKQTATGDYTPVIEKLIHYTGKEGGYPDGKSWKDANYYLYYAKDEWDLVDANFEPQWKEVPYNASKPIMKKGEMYAMHFPYNSLVGVHNPATTWDYWTGKYLLIESTAGVKQIYGKTYITDAVSNINLDESKAVLKGNPSFAEVQASVGANTTMWAIEKISAGEEGNNTQRDIHDLVRKTENITLTPSEGILYANLPAVQNMRAKTINYKTGEVTYEALPEEENKNDNPGVSTGVPTIMGDVSLIVVPTEEGLTIIPRKAQQVTLIATDGKVLFNKYLSAEEHVNVPTGVYVVRGEYEQIKAIKK